MANGKVVILSGDKMLARFFELEAHSAGLKTCVAEKCDTELEDALVTVIDIDTVKRIPSFGQSDTVIVSSKGSFPDFCKGSTCLTWPVSVELVKKIYEDAKHGTAQNVAAIPATDNSNTICFYKNAKNTVRYREKQIFLSDSEARLLELLCKSSPEPVSRETLGKALDSQQGNIVDVYICKLRKKLEEPFSKRMIFTVRNKGYKIIADMEWK